MKKMGNLKLVFEFISLLLKRHEKSGLKPRIAPRRASGAAGLYKVLDRDRFYGRHFDGAKNTMKLIDISTTGCAFSTGAAIPKGLYVEIEIDRLSQEHSLETPIIVSCETVYCLARGDFENRIGARFLEIDWKDVQKIRAFSEPQARGFSRY
ncbi:MAG: PilZ domain-containing protein [Candidatus Omnitrophota bacterium]